MKDILLSEDVYPVGEFKKHASRLLRRVKEEKRPVVVTQNGTPIGVVIPPEEYDRLRERQRFIKKVEEGLRQVEAGQVFTSEEVDLMLDKEFGSLKKNKKR